VLSGMVGVQVILRRLAFFTMALTHATFPGIVIAAIVGFNLYAGGAVAGLLAAVGVLVASRRSGQDTSTATGVVLATGFALGVALMSTQSGFTRNLSAHLVGSILTVERSDLLTAVLGRFSAAITYQARAAAPSRTAWSRSGPKATRSQQTRTTSSVAP
jgi:ABC-type Mn2+/Zn2+ transport system permease subunit